MATSDWMSLQKYQVQNATTPPMTNATIVVARQHVHALLHAPRQTSPQSSLHRFPQQHMCTAARSRCHITQYIDKRALLLLGRPVARHAGDAEHRGLVERHCRRRAKAFGQGEREVDERHVWELRAQLGPRRKVPVRLAQLVAAADRDHGAA